MVDFDHFGKVRPRHGTAMLPSEIRVRVISFGPLKAVFSPLGAWRELPVGSSVGTLLDMLSGERLVAPNLLCAAAVAVNHEYAGRGRELVDGDEVAILP